MKSNIFIYRGSWTNIEDPAILGSGVIARIRVIGRETFPSTASVATKRSGVAAAAAGMTAVKAVTIDASAAIRAVRRLTGGRGRRANPSGSARRST